MAFWSLLALTAIKWHWLSPLVRVVLEVVLTNRFRSRCLYILLPVLPEISVSRVKARSFRLTRHQSESVSYFVLQVWDSIFATGYMSCPDIWAWNWCDLLVCVTLRIIWETINGNWTPTLFCIWFKIIMVNCHGIQIGVLQVVFDKSAHGFWFQMLHVYWLFVHSTHDMKCVKSNVFKCVIRCTQMTLVIM